MGDEDALLTCLALFHPIFEIGLHLCDVFRDMSLVCIQPVIHLDKTVLCV